MDIGFLKNQLTSIVNNLERLGYVFNAPDEVMPGPIARGKIDKLEYYVGRLPSLFVEFYSLIGSINLIGEHPEWENDLYPDPFYMSSFEYYLTRAREFHEDDEERDWYIECYGGFALEVSPDCYHKAGVSGGDAYHIVLPSENDPIISGLENSPILSSYLKKVIRHAGFPGLECYQHNWPIENIIVE